MTFKSPHLLTKLEIWAPKYSAKYSSGERVALLAKYKVDQATPWILIEFTKAKHLLGQRYCVKRTQAQGYRIVSNNSIDCYELPMSALEPWDTLAEIKQTIESFGW